MVIGAGAAYYLRPDLRPIAIRYAGVTLRNAVARSPRRIRAIKSHRRFGKATFQGVSRIPGEPSPDRPLIGTNFEMLAGEYRADRWPGHRSSASVTILMRQLHSQIGPKFVIALVLLVGCSLPSRLDNAAATGGTHSGWGVAAPPEARATIARPAVVKDAPAEAEAPAATASAGHSTPSPSAVAAERPAAAGGEAATTAERQPVATPTAGSDLPGRAASVTRVSFADRSDGRGLVVRLHMTGAVPAYRVDESAPGRVDVTLFQSDLGTNVLRGEPRGPVRAYSLQSSSGRAILSLEIDPGVQLESRAYPDRDSNDLLVSLTAAPQAAASRVPLASATTAPAPTPRGVPSGADAASADHWKLDCIVIDAGHGGRDPGATRFGVRESDVTLGIALKLGRYVEENLGVRVVYTRRDDRFIELADRGRIANESCGKLFVSIHANAAANHSAHGTETYFLGMHRSESARQVMERENSVIALESNPDLYSGMDEGALILQTMAQSSYLRISEQLAGLIEDQFATRASRTSRGVKQAGFLVLWKASMPAVLVETGFISNREEARFLASDQGQDLIASAIFRAIREYKMQYERGLGVASN
jgi:N-acetylmuramoyl-L-alanine amidase